MSLVGVRVVRGPHWKWSDQDRGEGNLGTVCLEVDNKPNTVVVKWDNGICKNYSAGYEDQYDLRIFDNSYLGVMHNNACKGCESETIIGMKYRCSTCKFYDLCATCYHNDKHNVTHKFALFPTNTTIGINLPSRICSKTASLCSDAPYYYDHLPLLGKQYEQTETKNYGKETPTSEECICCDKPSSENVMFQPCNHKLACMDCAKMFKKCVKCRVPIKKLIRVDTNVLSNPEDARLRKLEDMLHEIEESLCCNICSENIVDTVFNCGHKACKICADRLSSCHMCRKLIFLRLPF